MNNQTDKLVKCEISTSELKQMPPAHAGFLVSSCLAIDEINLFQKVLLLSQNTITGNEKIRDKALQEIAYAQSVTIQRNLAAKVLEYLKLIGDYQTQCDRAKDSTMQAFIEKADHLNLELKKGDSYDLAVWYRNSVTNHYLTKILQDLIRNGDLGDDDAPHPIYLHEKNGNCYFPLGEQVLLAKLSDAEGSAIERINEFDDWVLEAARKLIQLHSFFCIQLFKTYLPKTQGVAFSITPESHLIGKLDETCLPILWDFHSLRNPYTSE